MDVCHHIYTLQARRKDPSRARATECCELQCGFWELDLGPLED